MPEVTLLLIDDDDVDAEAVKRAVARQRLPNPVVHVTTAVEALEILRGEHPTLSIKRPFVILLDLNMPKMSGHEFLNVLRSDSALRDCVVFALTTSEDARDMAWAYANHVAGYLVKSRAGRNYEELTGMFERYAEIVALPGEPPSSEDDDA